MAVAAAHQEIVARSVDADLVDDFLKLNELAAARRHLHLLAPAQEVDKLDKQDRELARVIAERLNGRFHPGHIAVMISAPHVDDALKAAVKLFLVIGDVRCEIRRHAVGAHQHAVFVVAVLSGAEPERVVCLIQMSALLQRLHSGGHKPAVVQRLLGEKHVERDAETGQFVLDLT